MSKIHLEASHSSLCRNRLRALVHGHVPPAVKALSPSRRSRRGRRRSGRRVWRGRWRGYACCACSWSSSCSTCCSCCATCSSRSTDCCRCTAAAAVCCTFGCRRARCRGCAGAGAAAARPNGARDAADDAGEAEHRARARGAADPGCCWLCSLLRVTSAGAAAARCCVYADAAVLADALRVDARHADAPVMLMLAMLSRACGTRCRQIPCCSSCSRAHCCCEGHIDRRAIPPVRKLVALRPTWEHMAHKPRNRTNRGRCQHPEDQRGASARLLSAS